MGALLLASLLAAGWSDASGRVHCGVPEGYRQVDGWTFTRGDGLRRLVFLPVHPVAVSPEERARALLAKAGASGVKLSGATAVGVLRGAPDVAAALGVVGSGELWPGVMLVGPAAAPLGFEVQQVLADCRSGAPVVEAGRIFDETRRVSCGVPAGARAGEVNGGGAAEGAGWVVRLIAAQPKGSGTLSDVAASWLAPSGATAQARFDLTSAAGLHASGVSGTFVRDGVTYVAEAVAVDLGDQVVGLGLTASVATEPAARTALRAMLDSLSFASASSTSSATPAPPPPPPPAVGGPVGPPPPDVRAGVVVTSAAASPAAGALKPKGITLSLSFLPVAVCRRRARARAQQPPQPRRRPSSTRTGTPRRAHSTRCLHSSSR